MKYFYFFNGIILLFVGFLIGASCYKSQLGEIKWTDVGIFIITLTTFLLALYPYMKWIKTKNNEDGYKVAKEYVNKFLFARLLLKEIDLACSTLADNIYLNIYKDKYEDFNEETKNYRNNINKLKTALNFLDAYYEEIQFWGLSLTKKGLELHNEFVKLNNEIIKIYFNLNSTIIMMNTFHNEKIDDETEIKFKCKYEELITTLKNHYKKSDYMCNELMKMKFEGLFKN